ncbi:MAG TPA: NADP oxidoreductase [Nitrospirae bacterium]|nr:NADP oxidoreductase [Nitrospirota bacterium]
MEKVKIATSWLDGCSGCHMSLLDIDERILTLLESADIVYGPLVDFKDYPQGVDVAIVEGAVSSDEDEEKITKIRKLTKILVSFGDCAITANIPGMRNYFPTKELYERAYFENADLNQKRPSIRIPHLLSHARPIHEVVTVDVFLPGCPPPADVIFYSLSELINGRLPDLKGKTRFGR